MHRLLLSPNGLIPIQIQGASSPNTEGLRTQVLYNNWWFLQTILPVRFSRLPDHELVLFGPILCNLGNANEEGVRQSHIDHNGILVYFLKTS